MVDLLRRVHNPDIIFQRKQTYRSTYLENYPADERNMALRQNTMMVRDIVDNYRAHEKLQKMERNELEQQELSWLSKSLNRLRLTSPQFYVSKSLDSVYGLPDDFKKVVDYIAMENNWDSLPVLLLMLVTIAAATWGKYEITINSTWSEALVLHLLICAESGNQKSAVFKMITRPLFNAEEHMQLNAEKSKSFDAMPNLFFRETTYPSLYGNMGNNGGGCNHFSPESTTFLNMINTPRAKLDIFAQSYDFENFQYDTKKDGKRLLVKPFMNIALCSNPDNARQIYSNQRLAANGITPRMMVCFSRKTVNPFYEREGSDSDYSAYMVQVEELVKRSYTQAGRRELQQIKFSVEATEELKGIARDIAQSLDGISAQNHGLRAYTNKVRGLIARIASTFHIWENSTDPAASEVQRHNVQLAKRIVDALDPHAAYAFDPAGLQAYYDALKILEWVGRHGHSDFSSTDVARGVANMKNANIFPALDYLENINAIRQLIQPGRPRLCVAHCDLFRKL